MAAIEGGYTSVMIDGSALPFEENVELTREVVKYAHARGVSVEGELGVLAGVEDHVFAANSTYTNPLSAIEFFKKDRRKGFRHFIQHVRYLVKGVLHFRSPLSIFSIVQ